MATVSAVMVLRVLGALFVLVGLDQILRHGGSWPVDLAVGVCFLVLAEWSKRRDRFRS